MSKTWCEVSNDGVTWMRLPEGVTRVEPFPYRFTRLIEEEDLGAYVGPGGLRRALEAIQSGILVSDSELANALRGATPEEEAWFSAELRKARPGAAPAEPDPKLGEAIAAANALARGPDVVSVPIDPALADRLKKASEANLLRLWVGRIALGEIVVAGLDRDALISRVVEAARDMVEEARELPAPTLKFKPDPKLGEAIRAGNALERGEVTVMSGGGVMYMETLGAITLEHHQERRDAYLVNGKVALAGDHLIGRLVPPDPVLGKPEFRPGLATVAVERRTSVVKLSDHPGCGYDYSKDSPEALAGVYLSGPIPTPRADAALADALARVGAEEHPTPWKWGRSGEDESLDEDAWVLQDADGNDLIYGYGRPGVGWAWPVVESPRVRALTEAAPQLEDVLVRLVARYDDDPEANGYQDLIDEARALLKQIEERSRG